MYWLCQDTTVCHLATGTASFLPLFAAIFYTAYMLYPFTKAWAKLALPFFAKRVSFVNPEMLNEPGPLLLACNHPNSFLDAIILGQIFKHPVYFMTRGDVFKKAWVRRIFSGLKMIPIFRIRDGKDKLSLNDETFIKSVEVLRNKQILLIFVEGFCENQTSLQLPLKKGAPRILQACWEEGIPVKVLPVWLEYSSFRAYGKTIEVRLGKLFGQEVTEGLPHAAGINQINNASVEQLLHLSQDYPLRKASLFPVMRWVLLIPAMLGAVLHAPLFLPVQALVKKLAKGNVHYDSIMLAFLMVLYPLYLLLITGILVLLSHQYWPLLVLLIFPLLAKVYQLWKK